MDPIKAGKVWQHHDSYLLIPVGNVICFFNGMIGGDSPRRVVEQAV